MRGVSVKIACESAALLDIAEMVEFQGNLKSLSTRNYERLKKEILETGVGFPFKLWRSDGKAFIIGGHQTKRTLIRMREEGYEVPRMPVTWVEARDLKEARRRVLQDASAYGKVEREGLYEFMHDSEMDFTFLDDKFDLPDTDLESFKLEFFSEPNEASEGNSGNPGDVESKKKLSDRFLVPPFTVLDARQGYWKERKRQWMDLGIQSELGRGEDDDGDRGWKTSKNSLGNLTERARVGLTSTEVVEAIAAVGTGTSIFDPVLCELAYRWFSPKNGNVLDPFAGGSVRGIVASKVGRQYVGIDLRERQIKANQDQAMGLCEDPLPVWICGDSVNIKDLVKTYQADLIFSCPPYGDLEVYSDDPNDISTLEYSEFIKSYKAIIKASVELLKIDRFACFVVGDFRDKKGIYRNFVSHTIEAFIEAGAFLYNEAILVTSLGSLPLRAGKSFTATRKLGKTHQNVLVFIKGDPKRATGACGEVEIRDLEESLSRVTASEEL